MINRMTRSPFFLVAVFLFFAIGGAIAVTTAQKRAAGATGLDAAQLEHMRQSAHERLRDSEDVLP